VEGLDTLKINLSCLELIFYLMIVGSLMFFQKFKNLFFFESHDVVLKDVFPNEVFLILLFNYRFSEVTEVFNHLGQSEYAEIRQNLVDKGQTFEVLFLARFEYFKNKLLNNLVMLA
jgi:hypothetical protein